jgi:antitoxin (DNA-binding transcriptional repressor) of toxin-antitoxin stability system
MERVTVAELKAKLSAYLRRVEGGEPIIVVRHGTPIAKLERVTSPQLTVRPPRRSSGDWWKVKGPRVPLKHDVLEYLADEPADRAQSHERADR